MPDPRADQAHRKAALALARQLVARLERLSADSFWAHRASGMRGALLRSLEQAESLTSTQEAASAPNAALHELERLVEQGYQILANAAREIEEPK